jgi:hypothetical protein
MTDMIMYTKRLAVILFLISLAMVCAAQQPAAPQQSDQEELARMTPAERCRSIALKMVAVLANPRADAVTKQFIIDNWRNTGCLSQSPAPHAAGRAAGGEPPQRKFLLTRL